MSEDVGALGSRSAVRDGEDENLIEHTTRPVEPATIAVAIVHRIWVQVAILSWEYAGE